MPRVNLLMGSYEGRSLNQNAQKCINWIPEVDNEGGKNKLWFWGAPGLELFCDTGIYAAGRGLHVFDGNLYACIGNQVAKVTEGGVATTLTGTLATTSGPVQFSSNPTQLMLVDPGSEGYTVGAAAITAISDADFPTPKSLTYQDGYGIVSTNDAQTFYISSLNDFTSWNALDFTSAEGIPDDILRIIMDHRELWVFGSESTEIFYNSGNTDFPFERISGGFLEVGLVAPASVAKEDNSLFWLDDKHQVCKAQGYARQVISTPQIDYRISQLSTRSDAEAFTYVFEGHPFYQITFPTDAVTFCYDIRTGIWHERASYPIDQYGNYDRSRAAAYAFFDGKHMVLDYETGKIFEVKSDVYDEGGETLPAKIVTQSLYHPERKWFFVNSFEAEFEVGVGLNTGQGSDPLCTVRYSKDGGHTWSNSLQVSMGKMGEYERRAILRRIGRARDIRFELTVTDPVKRVLTGLYVDYEEALF